jgi:hypothetical protein
MSQTAPGLADIEPTRPSNFWTVLAPKATVCESGMTVPADARAVSVVVGLLSGRSQLLSLTVSDARRSRTARVTRRMPTGSASSRRCRGPGAQARRPRNDGDARVGLGVLADRAPCTPVTCSMPDRWTR